MARTSKPSETSLPSAPPLFVTAFSEAGERQEALVERGAKAPEWLAGSDSVRVQSPGGKTCMADLTDTKSDLYDALLEIVGGAELAWASIALEGRISEDKLDQVRDRIDHIEWWVSGDDEPEKTSGPLFALRHGKRFNPNCFAVVHRTDSTMVYVPHAERFYIDLLPSPRGTVAVPRALADTSLAGAFWGYTEHNASDASRVAAGILLERLSDGSAPMSSAWLAASAHAVLFHREYLKAHGLRVRELLRSGTVPDADAAILIAFLGMALLALKATDENTVLKDLRAAVASLATNRVTYGETLRLLDAKFAVVADIARRELKDDSLEQDIRQVSSWLSQAYVGGQIAAYAGEAPLPGPGWHDALAQKKTSSI